MILSTSYENTPHRFTKSGGNKHPEYIIRHKHENIIPGGNKHPEYIITTLTREYYIRGG